MSGDAVAPHHGAGNPDDMPSSTFVPPKARQSGNPVARMRALLEVQVIRFGLVGVVNTAFGYGLFVALQLTIGTRVHYLGILGISHVFGVLEAYVLQRWLVFRVRGHWWRDLLRFWSVYLVSLCFNAVALPFLVEVVHITVIPAQGIILVFATLGTYVAHRNFSFRRPAVPGSGTDSELEPSAGHEPLANPST